MLDYKIVGGQVFDGMGADALLADIGIKGNRILDIEDLAEAEALVTIDAKQKYVCPGFIDVHSHSDAYILIEPSAPSKTYQGVTTEVVGNCGASVAPRVGDYKLPSDWRDKIYPGTWNTVAEYRKLLEQVAPAPNIYLLIGHNSLRAGVMGYEDRSATSSELLEMQKLLEESLDQGGRGLSSGLIYTPGLFAPEEEILTLAQVVARHEGIYTSHMRSESSHLLEAIDETLRVGEKTGVRVQISHLKTSGRNNWHFIDDALSRIRQARHSSLEVASDRYPYTASCTDLDVLLPDWALAGGAQQELSRLGNASTRMKIRDELLATRDELYWETVTIGSTSHPDNISFQGKPLLEVAQTLRLGPAETVLYLIESDHLSTGGIFSSMNEENMWKIFREPYVMVGSDGSIRAPQGPLSHDHPHPRAYGTFPKYLRAALDGITVSLPEAIRKMTSLPSEQFKIKDRGVLARGMIADVVIFDPLTVHENTSYLKPHQLSSGIELVMVNGVATLMEGTLTGKRGGIFLD